MSTFDLVLCAHTLSELPTVPAGLAVATLLREKVANSVLMVVEPGTPDGFRIMWSVRSILLECCPSGAARE